MDIPQLPCTNCQEPIPGGREQFVQITTAFRIEKWTLCPECSALLLREIRSVVEDD